MSAPDLRQKLSGVPIPDETAAEKRAWRMVSTAFAELRPEQETARASRRVALRPALAATLCVVTAAVAVTPPGAAIGDWVSDVVRPSHSPSRPQLTSLPADGRLLVDSSQGPWVVQKDGSKRRLGRYTESAWSPNGLYVVAVRGDQIAALEPTGAVRWALARSGPISHPMWSPDGFRIAYFSDDVLRVVIADGSSDMRIAPADPAVAPSWRPTAGHQLSYSDPAGRVHLVETDTGRTLWRYSVGDPRQLLWTPDGEWLVVVSDRQLDVLNRVGQHVDRIPIPKGSRAQVAAIDPTGKELALVQSQPVAKRSEVVARPLPPRKGLTRRLFAGSGTFDELAWSPDGRWLLVSWPEADQWLSIRSTSVSKIDAISNIGRQFDPGGTAKPAFPQVKGWCCPTRDGG